MKNGVKNLLLIFLLLSTVLFFRLWLSAPTEDAVRKSIEAEVVAEEEKVYDHEEWKDSDFVYANDLECVVAVAFSGEKPKLKLDMSFKGLNNKGVEVSFRGQTVTYIREYETKDRIWLSGTSPQGYVEITTIDKASGKITMAMSSSLDNELSSGIGYCTSDKN